MKVIKIKKDWFSQSDVRLDASYHLSDGPKTKRKLKRSPYPLTRLGEETIKLYSGNIFKRTFVENEKYGYPYITASDMMKSDINSGKFISKKYTEKAAQLMIKKDWILLSCSGTLGNVVYTNDEFEGKIGTHDLIRVIPNNKNVLGGYLYAYLASKYGYALLTQSSYGGVVKHIEPHHIKNLSVPIMPDEKQKEIHDLIIAAAALRVEANGYLREAIYILEKQFNYNKQDGCYFDKTSIKNINNNYQYRLDSPTFVNSGVNLVENLRKQGLKFKLLSDFKIDVTRPGIFKRVKINQENGLAYIKGSELNRVNPFKLCEYLSKTRTPMLDQLKLKENQILFTCAGTVGDIKIISKEYTERNSIGSQDIIRIESKETLFSNYFLFAYLKMGFIKEFIQSLKYGSVIERVEPFHVEKIPIILPDINIIKETERKVQIFKDSMYKAFKYEEKAINLIEKEIQSWQE